MTAIDCSIVVRAFNEEQHIARLFTGISQQGMKGLEVILVDSGSTDATIAIASAAGWHFPVRIVHIQPEEFSFGRSLNMGLECAQGKLVVIASAHVYPVYPDWINKLLAPFKDPQVALTYGKQRGNSITHFSENQVFARWYPEKSTYRQDHPFCNNANAAVRRNLWETHQYDESLSGLEDLEWANWVMSQGYAIAYSAEAEIIHVHHDSPQGIYNRYRREAMAFKRIFPREKFNLWDFVRLFLTNVGSDLYLSIQEQKLFNVLWEVVWFRFEQFWGTYQGYKQSGPLTRELRKTFYYPAISIAGVELQQREVRPIEYEDTA